MFASFALFAVNDSKTERPQYFLVRTVPVVRGSCNSKGLSVVILTAKCAKIAKACMACFSLFVPFPSFAVHDSKTECLLYFRRENHREMRENRERSYGLFVPFELFAVHEIQRECSLKFSPRNTRKPRKCVWAFLLVRAVRVVRGS